MSIAAELKEGLRLPVDCNETLRKFFSDDGSGDTSKLHSRSNSVDSELSVHAPDAEKPAGAEEWDGLLHEDSAANVEHSASATSWLSSCIMTSYCFMEYLILANGLKWAALARSTVDQNTFEVVTTKQMDTELDLTAQDYITCCCVFGLGSVRQSELWDGLIVVCGLSTGQLAFFTEKGILLLVERFSPGGPLLSVSFEQFDDGQLLTVVTESDIFSVNPFSLHATLLQAKTAIARREKNFEEVSNEAELECERVELEGRPRIRHAVFTGMHKPSSFQQYTAASAENFNRRVERSSLPSFLTFFAHTDSMFGTFAWHQEGEGGSIWTEAVSKITTSFVPHFGFRKFLGLSSGNERKTALSRPRRVAATRGVLNDSRVAASLSRAPSPYNLLAVSDCAARVVLIDVKQRQLIRLWKAYRDASVAWVTSSHEGRTALFLVVFAPRRALLEVWNVQNGNRVSAQHVDSRGILLGGGASPVLCGRRRDKEDVTAFFLDSKGSFLEIVVPFHLALLRNSSHEQHDQLLLAKMSLTDDSFVSCFSTLRTQKARRQAVLLWIADVSDATRAASTLKELQKADLPGALSELLHRVEKYIQLYGRLAGYCNRHPDDSEDELDLSQFNEQSIEIIEEHLDRGEHLRPLDLSLQSLFSFIDWHNETTNLFEMTFPDSSLLRFSSLVFLPLLSSSIDIDLFMDDVIPRLPYSRSDICRLFSFFVLHSSHRMRPHFARMVQLIHSFSTSSSSSGDTSTEADVFLKSFEKAAVESGNTSRALLLVTAMAMARKQLAAARKFEEEQGEEEGDTDAMDTSEGTASDWDAVDPSLEHVDCTIAAMHANWMCATMRQGCDYAKMIGGGGGYIREKLASWVVERGMDVLEWETELEDGQSPQRRLRELLPLVTSSDLIYCDMGWELASHWFKHKSEQPRMLESALSFVSAISDARLRHGVSRLLWDKFLSDCLRSLSSLVEKTGRPPKEREARQIIGLEERYLLPLLDRCSSLLSILMESVREAPPPSTVHIDHLMEVALSHPPSCLAPSSPRDSLAHMASRQALSNYHLVVHHCQLVQVYRMQISCNLRLRPLSSLFCPVGQRAFFLPIDSHPLIPLDKVDDVTMEQRNAFLAKVAENGSEDDRRTARELAHQWALTVDSISLMQLVSLLREGDDVTASQSLPSQTSNALGARMARLLAARMFRLAAEANTVLTSTHHKYLLDMAGDETSRVQWDGDWRDAVLSLGRLCSSLSLVPSDATLLVRLSNLATQYWALQWNR